MLKRSNNRQSNTEDHENKLIIEKWMKRNSNNKVTIGQNVEKSDSPRKKLNNTVVSINTSKCDIKVSAKKKVIIPVEISDNKSNNLTTIKRTHSLSLDNNESNTPKTKKICRQSLPPKGASSSSTKTNIYTNSSDRNAKLSNNKKSSIEVIPTTAVSKILPKTSPKSPKLQSESIPVIQVIKTTNNIIDNEVNLSKSIIKSNIVKTTPAVKGNQIIKKLTPSVVKCNFTETSPVTKGNQIIKHLSPPVIKCNAVKTSPKKGITGSENNTVIANTNNTISNLLTKKDEDVFICLLENYRYLVIPKAWSVNEFTNEIKNRYVIFFNTQVIEDKGILISVMKKSLIIDKGGTINYSVHGLPVDIKGTILPKTLDNTKKLLSILHIFDKMHVCEGIGSDFNVVQNSVIFKDCCRHWRHQNCKIILIKAMRCSVCADARNELIKQRSVSQPNAINTEIEFIDVSVKTEGTFYVSEET